MTVKQDLSRIGPGVSRGNTLNEFAQRLLARAASLGLTKGQLATKAGISRQTLENLLKVPQDGHQRPTPSVRTCIQLAHALRVHPAWIVEGLFVNVLADVQLDVQMSRRQSSNVEDLNFAEGVVVAPLTRFEKRWRVTNHTQQAWHGHRLECQDPRVTALSKATGEALYAAGTLEPDVQTIELPDLQPGQAADIAMLFTAPRQNGMSISRWLAVDSVSGQACDPVWGVWVLVHVTTLADTIAFEPLPK